MDREAILLPMHKCGKCPHNFSNMSSAERNELSKKGRHWCFTINNYTEETEQLLGDLGESDQVSYLVFGREVAPTTGTPHLQGFISFVNRKNGHLALGCIGGSGHLERAKGSPFQAAVYCKKETHWEEFGEPPKASGKKGVDGQFELYKNWVNEWVVDHGRGPYESEIALAHPALFCRYNRSLLQLTHHIAPPVRLQEGEIRDWQIDLNNVLTGEGNDRVVMFYVDVDGGKGKSYFQRWFMTNNPTKAQLLAPGKRDDIAHAIDVSKTVFLFNIPRGSMEFLQYAVLEQLKDRVIFSPKYESQTKMILEKTHVVVFCNEHPDMTKMSRDRYHIVEL